MACIEKAGVANRFEFGSTACIEKANVANRFVFGSFFLSSHPFFTKASSFLHRVIVQHFVPGGKLERVGVRVRVRMRVRVRVRIRVRVRVREET
jgi:hypothetical protein